MYKIVLNDFFKEMSTLINWVYVYLVKNAVQHELVF